MNRTIIKKLMIIILSSILMITNYMTVSAEATTDIINSNKIDEFIKLKMKSEKIPGVSLAIVKGNNIAYLKGYGVAATNGRPVTPETPFIIGSLSKSFTALAIMQLKEKGKIDIDAPVQNYLPWFSLADAKASKEITISNLLSQTSGLSSYCDSENNNISIEQIVRNQKNTQITKPINTTFQYSNINYIILGEVIQAVSGESYDSYIEKNIFQPLEMKKSYTSSEKAKNNGLSSGYRSYFGFMLPMKQNEHISSVPAGYLVSSSEDMAHYLIAEMNKGIYKGKSIISEEGMEETHTPISNVTNIMGVIKFTGNYGMGWFIDNNDDIVHAGDVENFHSYAKIVKSENLGIVMLFNSNDYISTLLSKNESYEDISTGVINILQCKEALPNNNLSIIRAAINAIGIIILLLLLLLSPYKLLKWKKRLKANMIHVTTSMIWLTLISIVIPLLIVVCIHNSIKFLIPYIPDFCMLLILLLLVAFIIGIIKMVLLIAYIKNK